MEGDQGLYKKNKARNSDFITNIYTDVFGAKTEQKLMATLWESITIDGNYIGVVGREKIKELYDDSCIGMLLLHPLKSFRESLPIKLFEYMAAGMPVLASDFPLWKEIIEENQCGVCVNPLDLEEIRYNLKKLVNEKDLAAEFGKNGRALVLKKFNWNMEKLKLLDLYSGILGYNTAKNPKARFQE